MAQQVIWTNPAKEDLYSIYNFVSDSISEQKGYETVKKIVSIGRVLEKKFVAASRYRSKIDPEKDYRKLVWKHYLIIFKQEGQMIFMNRVFDARQNPEKLKL